MPRGRVSRRQGKKGNQEMAENGETERGSERVWIDLLLKGVAVGGGRRGRPQAEKG